MGTSVGKLETTVKLYATEPADVEVSAEVSGRAPAAAPESTESAAAERPAEGVPEVPGGGAIAAPGALQAAGEPELTPDVPVSPVASEKARFPRAGPVAASGCRGGSVRRASYDGVAAAATGAAETAAAAAAASRAAGSGSARGTGAAAAYDVDAAAVEACDAAAYASGPAAEEGLAMTAHLELHLTVDLGGVSACAKHLAAEVRGPHWEILVALAGELMREHENRTASTVIVVAGADQAERVLADLAK